MIIKYLHMDIASDCTPLPNPSNAPEEVTDTADGIKPMLISRSAVLPTSTVSGLSVNRPIRD